ncbi:terminase large subunit [Gilliamella intestini]|uniref:Phage terminase-like protein, large subunit, contains N-terminal HTH domain n=1 Tax=Gilliamella intestini TaxID=1798183 RepID=A0A1C4BWT1_9GAMM|nr:terminase TerL endonuclease subunit [Gilliamella intestini]SCC11376.1 Phage terminase-like protein, large subunit, contains N-terminal HTH domain [Gilliamella intestini]
MTRGEKVIAFIERYCRVPDGEHLGEPMQLADFQKKFILEIYDNPHGTHSAYLSIARKNGKTGLIAGLLLAHLVGPEAVQNSQIVSGAMSREQAAIVFDLAVKIVNLNPELQRIVRVVPSGKRLYGLLCNVEYKALAAEGKTAHGLSPILAILDEVGQIVGPRSDFVDAITTSQGAHKAPLLIAISTQAANDADLFSVWLDDAKNSNDPHIVSHVYSAEKNADVLDEDAWKAANPALGLFRSYDDLKRLANAANRMPSEENKFRNLNLNQRVSVVSPFVSRNVWESCSAKPTSEDIISFAGLDLSQKNDLTAFVVISKTSDGHWNVHPYFWATEVGIHDRSKRDRVPYDVWAKQGYLRTTPRASIDYEYLVKELDEIIQEYNISAIAFDRYHIDFLIKEFERINANPPLVKFGQGFKDMTPALSILEDELLNGTIRHGNHPILTMCAANAVVTRDEADNRKFDKHKATGRIDGMQALAMAFGVTNKEDELENNLSDHILNVGIRSL